MGPSLTLPIAEPTQAGDARRAAIGLAEDAGFDETSRGRVALVVTELATNIVKHAGTGTLLLRSMTWDSRTAIEVLALDRGPGMDVQRSLRDGFSTAGSAGTGLGAVERLSTTFDVCSIRGVGTVIAATVTNGRAIPAASSRARFDVGVVRVPMPREEVCGDGWAVHESDDVLTVAVVDGLGHGALAFAAAKAAVEAFEGTRGFPPGRVIETIHAALRPTRGAAVAAAAVDRRRRVVTFAGVGNVVGTVVGDVHDRQMVSHPGIAGHEARRIAEFTYPWPEHGVLVVATDGLITHWDLRRYPGLIASAAAVIAGVLYRDFARGRDDVTVVVAKESRP